MITHQGQRMPAGGPPQLMITQGYDEDHGDARGQIMHQDGGINGKGPNTLAQFSNEDGYEGALQILDNGQRGYNRDLPDDELARQGLQSDYLMRPPNMMDENYRSTKGNEHDLMQRPDPQGGQMISNQQF